MGIHSENLEKAVCVIPRIVVFLAANHIPTENPFSEYYGLYIFSFFYLLEHFWGLHRHFHKRGHIELRKQFSLRTKFGWLYNFACQITQYR